MAEENSKIEYHLTPGGWVAGTSTTFGKKDVEKARPGDAVETWEEHTYQRSMWSPETVTYKVLWHDTNVSEADRKKLRRKHAPPFTKIPSEF